MLISYGWLKQYVNHDLSPEALADTLTSQACPIESTEALADGDTCLELEVTFNRPDLLSHLGVAREVAAATGAAVTEPEPAPPSASADPITARASVAVNAADLCPRYTARVIRGITVKASPAWLQTRIEAIGLRPVNNIVDVTNFVLHEAGQPLHAFDLDTLRGQAIVVRRAVPGETMVAIDGTSLTLDPETLVIADAERAVAVAGIMGGQATEISDGTRNILIESAYFDPVATRRAVRRLGLRSDSSHRFERGVDPGRVDWASRRTAELILEVAGGTLCAGVIDVDAGTLPGPQRVELRIQRLAHLAGIAISADEAARLLRGLGMEVETARDNVLAVTVPTTRHEVSREVDLIEEVLRCYGYDKVPLADRLPAQIAAPDVRERLVARVKSALVGAGYREIYTLSFIASDPVVDPALFTHAPARCVQNPVRQETPALRRSLFGPLVETKKTNLDRGNRAVRLFEISTVYLPKADGEIEERVMLGLLADDDVFGVKGALDAVARAMKLSSIDVRAVAGDGEDAPWIDALQTAFDPLERGAVVLHRADSTQTRVGWIGRVGRKVLQKFDLSAPAPTVLLVDFAPLLEAARLVVPYRHISPFPEVARDLAAVVDGRAYVGDLLAAVRALASSHDALASVELLSVFEGDGKSLAAGSKSVALRMVCRAIDRTLTASEADVVREAAKATLQDRFAATFRE